MQHNNPNLAVLSAEPLFYGKDKLVNGVSAEDFVRRITALAAGNGWTDQQTAGYATGFLRGDAANWLTRAVRAKDLLMFNDCTTSWIAFKENFVAEWFTIKEAADVHTDWLAFKQNQDESFMHFGNRVCAATTHFTDHLPPVAPPQLQLEALYAAIRRAVRQGRPGDFAYDDLPEVYRTAVDDAVGALWAVSGTTFIGQATMGLAVRTLSNGAKLQKVRDLVRTKERAKEPIAQIIRQVAAVEVDLLNTRATSSAAAAIHSPAEDLYDEDELCAMLAKKRQQQKKKPQPQQQKKPVPAAATAEAAPVKAAPKDKKLPPAACKFCGLMHWHRDCPLRQAAAAAKVSATNTDQLDFMGNHSGRRPSPAGNANAGDY